MTPDTAPSEELDIIYQDNYLVAVHKPAGLLVHKSPIDKHETRYAMRLLRDQLGQWVYPVHRLDKPTSGLLLFALDKTSAQKISDQFENRTVSKSYKALVRGYTAEEGTIDHPLKEIAAFKHQQKIVETMEPKTAQTAYKRLSRFELPYPDGRFETSRYSLLALHPSTGRKHQIRRHLKHISHPIVGDVKYGKGPHNRLFRDEFDCQRLLLAAEQLSLTHPVTEQALNLYCPLAKEFNELLLSLTQFQFDPAPPSL